MFHYARIGLLSLKVVEQIAAAVEPALGFDRPAAAELITQTQGLESINYADAIAYVKPRCQVFAKDEGSACCG